MEPLRYRRLLLSVGQLLVLHPQLRLRIVYGAVTFAGFGALWTTVALLAADRYHYGEAMGWIAGAYGGNSLAALILSLILIDLGVQGIHIANQSAIYRLDPMARNRITTAYITLYFGGGAIGSVTAAVGYGRAGWPAVVVSGIVFTAIGIVIWALRAQQCKAEVDDDVDV